MLPLTGELDAIRADRHDAGPRPVRRHRRADLGPASDRRRARRSTSRCSSSPAPPAEVAAGYPTKLVVCLPPPDVPVGTPGRAAFGAKLLSAHVRRRPRSPSRPPPATTAGRRCGRRTTPARARRTPAGTVETQAIRHVPTELTADRDEEEADHATAPIGSRQEAPDQGHPHAGQVLGVGRPRTAHAPSSVVDLDDRRRQAGRWRDGLVHPRRRQVGDGRRDRAREPRRIGSDRPDRDRG